MTGILEKRLPPPLQFLKPTVMPLQVPVVFQHIFQTPFVACHLIVFIFHPREKGRVVRMPNLQRDRIPVQYRLIEVIQALYARKKRRRIAAEKHHELGIPNPNRVIPQVLIHIG